MGFRGLNTIIRKRHTLKALHPCWYRCEVAKDSLKVYASTMSRRRSIAGLYPNQNQQAQEWAGVRTNKSYATWQHGSISGRQECVLRRHNARREQARKYLLLWPTLPVILPLPIYIHLLHFVTTLLGTTSWPPTSLKLCLRGEEEEVEHTRCKLVHQRLR